MREFEKLGWVVFRIDTSITLTGSPLLQKIKRRLQRSSEYVQLERSLIELADREKPLWVHFRLPTEFSRATILELKKRNIVVTQYCNDDAFSKKAPFALYNKLRTAVPAYDGHFVFRYRNVKEYLATGAKHVEHCPPTYDAHAHNQDQRAKDSSFIADAAFIGHFEDDGRLEYIQGLHKAGFNIILKGGMWDAAIKNSPLSCFLPMEHAFGEEYNRIYSNVIAGLCFFSKINNDEWTRRAPEIIAIGGLLVCERTDEAQRRFKDKKEAFFFSSVDELIEIVDYLIKNPQIREMVRVAGYDRLMKDGYALSDRALQIHNFVKKQKLRNIKD
jgi:spore maturation protein CgeB